MDGAIQKKQCWGLTSDGDRCTLTGKLRANNLKFPLCHHHQYFFDELLSTGLSETSKEVELIEAHKKLLDQRKQRKTPDNQVNVNIEQDYEISNFISKNEISSKDKKETEGENSASFESPKDNQGEIEPSPQVEDAQNSQDNSSAEKNYMSLRQIMEILRTAFPLYLILVAIYTWALYLLFGYNYLLFASFSDLTRMPINPFLVFAMFAYIFCLSRKETELRKEDEIILEKHLSDEELLSLYETNLKRPVTGWVRNILLQRRLNKSHNFSNLNKNFKNYEKNTQVQIANFHARLSKSSDEYIQAKLHKFEDIIKLIILPLLGCVLAAFFIELGLMKFFAKDYFIETNSTFAPSGIYKIRKKLENYYFLEQEQDHNKVVSLVVPSDDILAFASSKKIKNDGLVDYFRTNIVDTNSNITADYSSGFVTNIILDNEVKKELNSVLILPYFSGEITPNWPLLANQEKKEKEIFMYAQEKSFRGLKFGSSVNLKLNCDSIDCQTDEYFKALRTSLLYCAHQADLNNDTFEIQLQGFASNTGFEKTSLEDSKRLNHLLAEGRRRAILNKLGFEYRDRKIVLEDSIFLKDTGGANILEKTILPKDDIAQVVRVYLKKGQYEPKQYLTQEQTSTINKFIEEYGFEFSNFDEMETKLNELMGVSTELNTEKYGTGVSEAFSRAVIISFPDGKLKYCSS